MNAPIVRIFYLFVGLCLILVINTSRWSVFEAQSLRANVYNHRPLFAEERIKRGVIRSADGKVLASSVRISDGRYRRRYPLGSLFSDAVGYSFTLLGRTGIEQAHNDELTGRHNALLTVFDELASHDRVGDDIVTTLNARAQQVARAALAGRKGAVVALDTHTGAVLAMVSNPSYDPNDLDRAGRLGRLNQDKGSPLVNRATQSSYPPGSTFKTVTATAALDTHRFTPDSVVNGDSPKVISGVPLQNFGGKSFGDITLTDALTHSVNTVWAQVGVTLGRSTLGDYMQKFGFGQTPALDYPRAQMLPSGVFKHGRLVSTSSQAVDLGRVSIGQGDLGVTPLQMATVAQTIGNDGVRMRPYFVNRAVSQDGRRTETVKPTVEQRVMSSVTARTLTKMMKNVVREGTGTQAALQGVEVAGKTGTAEIDIAHKINDLWFIGFTPRVAIAVVLERVTGGQGGTVAAPVAKKVLQSLNR